jgi:hypothetical protein
MSSGERQTEPSFRNRVRDLAISVLAFAVAQLLLALLFWQLIFRTHPQGFAMGLTLVGFASWGIAFLASFRRPPRMASPLGSRLGSRTPEPPPAGTRQGDPTAGERLQARFQSAGCGTVLLLSGLISLGLAFVLRVRADMQSGLTWSDIFPTQP